MKETKWVEVDADKLNLLEGIKETGRYKDLTLLFVKRDLITVYKQTILGPLWIVIQPLLTTFTFTIIFTKIAGIETGIHPVLFYLSGVVLWTFFSETLTKVSDTFHTNQQLFGKVYFPRLIIPAAVLLTNGIKLLVQLLLFLVVLAFFLISDSNNFGITAGIIVLPLILIMTGIMGMAVGMIISAATIKYRDIKYLVLFGVQLLMYFTPIVYPLDLVPEKVANILKFNPIAVYIEYFRGAVFGTRSEIIDGFTFMVAAVSTLILFLIGLYLFNKAEKSFIDTI